MEDMEIEKFFEALCSLDEDVVLEVSEEDASKEKKQNDYCGMLDKSFPEPALAHYWRDREDRILWIEDKIDEDIIGVARNIVRWNHEDKDIPIEKRKPIKLYINSPGGLLTPTFAVCNAILLSKTPIWAINMHEAASAAALIFACCHRRVAMPYAYFLLHLGAGGTYGTYQQSKAQQEDYNHQIESLIGIFKKRLNLNDELEKEFDTHIDGEWYLYMDITDESKQNARRFNLVTDEIDNLIWE